MSAKLLQSFGIDEWFGHVLSPVIRVIIDKSHICHKTHLGVNNWMHYYEILSIFSI